jgi:hypothetical protein
LGFVFAVPGSRFQVRRSTFLFAILLLVLMTAAGCSTQPRAAGVYAPGTRALVRVDFDYDGDGRIDVRTYMRDGTPTRLEGDTNGDGLVDRWEYYDASGALTRVGGSTAGDGREDTWLRAVGDERHVEISTRRDGTVDRREVYRGEQLLRADSDTNHDGLSDIWETFDHGAITELRVDDDKRHGRPTRRVVYGAKGTARIELLSKEDGHASR